MLICVHLCFQPALVAAQKAEEVVANLAAGRVAIYVAKDGIAIGAVENRVEAGARPPVLIPLSSQRVGILLGAVEWLEPASGAAPVRLERQLLRLMGELSAPSPRLQQEHAGDIESIGLSMLEALRKMTSRLHHKVDLGEEESLVELVLVGYVENYGPEVWSLRYRIVQEPVRGSYWRTRLLRPRYVQLYPPEKGQPRTLVEVRYPADGAPALLERWQQDPSLARLRDPQFMRAADFLAKGESDKSKLDDATPWLRALLDTSAPPDTTQVFAVIRLEGGFQWILEPPEGAEKAEETAPREPGAPTLRKKP